jgi:hypothetical protein
MDLFPYGIILHFRISFVRGAVKAGQWGRGRLPGELLGRAVSALAQHDPVHPLPGRPPQPSAALKRHQSYPRIIRRAKSTRAATKSPATLPAAATRRAEEPGAALPGLCG